MSVEDLAHELGLHVLRTLELCRSAGVRAGSGADRLTDAEADRVRALVRSGSAPSGHAVPPPPPPPQFFGPRPGTDQADAATALIMGILAMVVPLPFVFGIIGLVLASKASRAIVASGGYLGGEGKVTAARVLSIISLSIWGLLTFFFVIGVIVGDDEETEPSLELPTFEEQPPLELPDDPEDPFAG